MLLSTTLVAQRAPVGASRVQRGPARSLAFSARCQVVPAARRRGLVCRAEKPGAEPASDSEGHDFYSLAKDVAGQLASDLAGREDTHAKLQSWLAGGATDTEEGASADAGPRSEGESTLGKAARLASEVLVGDKEQSVQGSVGKLASMAAGYLSGRPEGTPHTDQAGEVGNAGMMARLAAEHLGLPSWTVSSVKNWLSNPSQFEKRDDARMVGALVHRLLQSFETHTGESFNGNESQFDWLYNHAKSVLGSSMTRSLVKRLVTSYLGLPLR